MKSIYIFLTLFLSTSVFAQDHSAGLRAIGTPHNPKVTMSWNKYHNLDEIADFCNRLAKAYPDLVSVEVIGKSYEKRDILAMTITDLKAGKPEHKPAFYIQANIHSNELQGTEFSMYTAWYLCENYGKVDFITQMLKEKTFYILPTINPDGRFDFITRANNANTPRSGVIPMDDDADWEINEDMMDDLDGDGHITMMRRKSPNGRFDIDPEYPERMVPVKPGEAGTYEMLGMEGIDNDGDARVNEDRTGYYDPNRDWGWNWQPDYVQGGAYKYPFSTPEIRAVKTFIMTHPNIGGGQSYHNYGGMFLRGPGAEEDLNTYDRSDIAVYDLIGKAGETMIPGYRYLTTYKDLYSVFGGDLDFMHGALGIYAFVNENMISYLLFHRKTETNRFQNNEFYEFDKYLLFGDAYVKWKAYKHPQFGEVEIGGPKKNYIRNHPGFLLEEDAHRNMAFTLYHAYHTPKLELTEVNTKKLSNNLKEITITITNSRMIPTHSSHNEKNMIGRPDYISLVGADVVTSFVMSNVDFNLGKEQLTDPAKVRVENIPGMGTVKVRWIVRDKKKQYNLIIDSEKAGYHTMELKVED